MNSLVTKIETETAANWIRQTLTGSAPFSFRYNGQLADRLLPQWQRRTEVVPHADGTTVHQVIYREDETGLECLLELTVYPDSSAVEWLVRFRNTGSATTSILEDIQALDLQRDCPTPTDCQLHYSKGTRGTLDDFILQHQPLPPTAEIKMLELDDGSSRQHLPFFNLETGNSGVMIGIGWTGNWACSFTREVQGAVVVRAGLARTHLVLYPGEEIRTPRILLLFWDGDRRRGHNLLRRHLATYHLPRPGGHPAEAPICCLTWGGMKTENHLKLIQFIRDHGLKYDYYWIDAGWFGPDHATDEFQNFHTEDWAYQVGHWRVNAAVHPHGLAPIAAAAHAAGMKLLLWCGPYLAEENSPIVKEHPDWIIKRAARGQNGIGSNPKTAVIYEIDLGRPAALRYMSDLFSNLIRDQHLDCFRDDCGIPFATDEPVDRQGISEIRCVTAFYAFWDELLQRHPGLLIDNCSGGASRVDLETIGRSLVLWRSDYNCDPAADPIASQVGSYGLAHWVPLVGGAPPARPGNTYNFRSAWSGGLPFGLFHPCGYGTAPTAPAPDYPIAWHQQMIEQYRQARKYYTGDFYPLTECTLSPRDWLAYQMDRPDLGEGLIMALRRPESPVPTMQFQFQGLDRDASYEIVNVDTTEIGTMSGRALAEVGLAVTLTNAPDSRLLFYKRQAKTN